MSFWHFFYPWTITSFCTTQNSRYSGGLPFEPDLTQTEELPGSAQWNPKVQSRTVWSEIKYQRNTVAFLLLIPLAAKCNQVLTKHSKIQGRCCFQLVFWGAKQACWWKRLGTFGARLLSQVKIHFGSLISMGCTRWKKSLKFRPRNSIRI